MEELFQRLFERWKILRVTYRDVEKSQKISQHLLYGGFMTYNSALKSVRRRELHDTMEDDFTIEYVIIRNLI